MRDFPASAPRVDATSRSTVLRALTAPLMFERSKSSSVIATYQPRLTSPTTFFAGMRTSS